MQTMLIVLVLFMGFQLFFGNKQAPEKRPSKEILAKLQQYNKDVVEAKSRESALAAVTQEHSKLEAKIAEELQEKQIDAETAKTRKIEGMVILGDTLLKAGVAKNDTGPLTQAYYMLHGMDKTLGERLWAETPVTVTPGEKYAATTTTAKGVYDNLVAELRVQFEAHLINGVLPGFRIIDSLVALTGRVPAFSYAFAAVLLALLVRAIVWPLTQKQYMFGRQMSQLSPLIKEVKERYTDKKTGQVTDMAELNRRTMELYKEYGVNPMAGCLPMLIQIPFFLVIYQCMQNYRFEFQKGTFLWINEGLSRATNGFIAPNLGEKDNILIVIYAISMVVTAFLTPVSDPNNAKQQRIMSVSMSAIFSIMMFFYPLPSAFILYWVALNIFATWQMLHIYRLPAAPLVKKNAPGGGVFPTDTPVTFSGPNAASSTGKPVKHKPKKKK